jgi:hypothetical protein
MYSPVPGEGMGYARRHTDHATAVHSLGSAEDSPGCGLVVLEAHRILGSAGRGRRSNRRLT